MKFWFLRIGINNQQIFLKLLSFVRLFGAVDGITSIKTHLKGAFGFNGTLDIALLFIEEKFHEVQKGSASIFSSASSHTLAVSPAIKDLVDMCPNL